MRFDISGGPPAVNQGHLERLIVGNDVRTVLEIGSFLGSSAAWFAKHKQIERVACVDPFRVDPQSEWGKALAVRGIPSWFFPIFHANLVAAGVIHKIVVHAGLSRDMVAVVEDADLVYVDGDHSLEGCMSDIKLYMPKARKVLCGDDHHSDANGVPYFPGVVEACRLTLGAYLADENFWCWIRDPEKAFRC